MLVRVKHTLLCVLLPVLQKLHLAFGGFDTLAGGPGNDDIFGGSLQRPLGGSKVMSSGPGDNLLLGGLGVDTLEGQEGADVLVDGPPREFSQDTLSGGTGNDTFNEANRPASQRHR